MVSDALQYAADFQQIAENTLEQIAPCGACLSVEAVADVLERLAVRRSYVCSVLLSAYSEASEKERRELLAAFSLVNSANKRF